MFPKEFPQNALVEVLKGKDASIPHLVLGGYELLGYGLYLYFGEVKYMPQGQLELIQSLSLTADAAQKITDRARQLKAEGMVTWLIIMQLLMEFGPVILKLAMKIRELLRN